MINFSRFRGKKKKYQEEFRKGYGIEETYRQKILRERREKAKEQAKRLIPFSHKFVKKPQQKKKYRYTPRKRIYL